MSLAPGHVGEIAALGAAMCWAITSLVFAAAGRRIGPTAVNFTRILLALGVLFVVNRVLFGEWLPPVAPTSVIILGISGLIGLALGDQLLFTALVDVGPRLSTLLMTIAPPVTAIIAWPVLDEPLGALSVLGVVVTLTGIVWVVQERRGPSVSSAHWRRGVMLGASAGVCQALGLVLSKIGMGQDGAGGDMAHVDPWTATQYRMAFAAAGVVLLTACLRKKGSDPFSAKKGSDPFFRAKAMGLVCAGVVFGPVLGVWCSMVAVDRADAGVAATLMATTPVVMLPLARWIEREQITLRAVIGALVAVGGVAILTLANGAGGAG